MVYHNDSSDDGDNDGTGNVRERGTLVHILRQVPIRNQFSRLVLSWERNTDNDNGDEDLLPQL